MHNRKEADEKNAHRLCVRRGAATAWEGPRTPRMNAARARNPPARCQNPSQTVRMRLTLSDKPGPTGSRESRGAVSDKAVPDRHALSGSAKSRACREDMLCISRGGVNPPFGREIPMKKGGKAPEESGIRTPLQDLRRVIALLPTFAIVFQHSFLLSF